MGYGAGVAVARSIDGRGDRIMDRVRALRDLIERSAADETATQLSDEVLDALEQADIFKLMAPAAVGGLEADPQTVIDVLGELSRYDGSAGWHCQAASTSVATAGAFLGDRAVDAIFFSGRKATVAGNGAPNGRIERVADGWRVSGDFTFASGSPGAAWLGGGYLLHKDGAPSLREDGSPVMMIAMVPRNKVEFLGNWDVIGLRGSGSYDFRVLDQVVHDDFVVDMAALTPKRGGALYRMSFLGIPSLAHSGFALGCPRRALDEWIAFAARKRRIGGGLANESDIFQRDLALSEAELQAAEAYVRHAFAELFDAAVGGKLTDDIRVQAKLATAHSLAVGTRVTQRAFAGCTTTALRNGSAIQRCFRDMQAGNAHIMTGEQSLIDAGRYLAGIDRAIVW